MGSQVVGVVGSTLEDVLGRNRLRSLRVWELVEVCRRKTVELHTRPRREK